MTHVLIETPDNAVVICDSANEIFFTGGTLTLAFKFESRNLWFGFKVFRRMVVREYAPGTWIEARIVP
jgi:hypothetical protein